MQYSLLRHTSTNEIVDRTEALLWKRGRESVASHMHSRDYFDLSAVRTATLDPIVADPVVAAFYFFWCPVGFPLRYHVTSPPVAQQLVLLERFGSEWMTHRYPLSALRQLR